MSRFSVSSIVVLLVGAALGYVAASGGPISLFAARAASDGAVAPAGTDSAAEPTCCQEEGESCCTEGLGRNAFVALVSQSGPVTTVSAQRAAASGGKPNIPGDLRR